jgi:hypothetical protein
MRDRLRAAKVKAADVRPRVQNFGIEGGLPSVTLGESRFAHDKVVACQVLADLEDRRVLYHPWSMEAEDQCVASVLDMRRMLTEKIGQLDHDSPLAPLLRQIRAACRRFLDDADGPGRRPHFPVPVDGDFWSALGELRAITGVCVATMAARYDLDVEPELAVYLPPAPSDDD